MTTANNTQPLTSAEYTVSVRHPGASETLYVTAVLPSIAIGRDGLAVQFLEKDEANATARRVNGEYARLKVQPAPIVQVCRREVVVARSQWVPLPDNKVTINAEARPPIWVLLPDNKVTINAEARPPICRAFGPDRLGLRGYICTRAAGHDGDHAALNSDRDAEPYATWKADDQGDDISQPAAKLRTICAAEPPDWSGGYVCMLKIGHEGRHSGLNNLGGMSSWGRQ